MRNFNATLVMLDGRRDGGGSAEFGGSPAREIPSGGGQSFELDDEIPF